MCAMRVYFEIINRVKSLGCKALALSVRSSELPPSWSASLAQGQACLSPRTDLQTRDVSGVDTQVNPNVISICKYDIIFLNIVTIVNKK